MNILLERPTSEVNFGVQIPLERLIILGFSAIILKYKGRQDQVDTPEFKQSILGQSLES